MSILERKKKKGEKEQVSASPFQGLSQRGRIQKRVKKINHLPEIIVHIYKHQHCNVWQVHQTDHGSNLQMDHRLQNKVGWTT